MPRNDVILWLDLETTGLSDKASIIEVGAVLTDSSPQLNALGGFHTVIGPRPTSYEDDVVTAMHVGSGLDAALKDVLNPTVQETEKMFLRWLNSLAGNSTEHIPLAGSGVAHFDRKYIRRDWPMLDKRLTYWAYDIGVIRRSFQLLGLPMPPKTNLPHRALQDVLVHLEEARYYFAQLQNLLPQPDPEPAEELTETPA